MLEDRLFCRLIPENEEEKRESRRISGTDDDDGEKEKRRLKDARVLCTYGFVSPKLSPSFLLLSRLSG